MYVRLKHTLSALALEAVRGAPRSDARAAAVWVTAFCEVAGPAESPYEASLASVTGGARRKGAGLRGLTKVLDAGLLLRHDGALVLPEAFRPHFPYLCRQVNRLAAALHALQRGDHVPRTPGADAIRQGTALFNAGLFFESHEFFEDIWRAAPAEDRGFYQGLILISAAFYHQEKGNLHGARVKLTQGLKRLEPYPPHFLGVRLAPWLHALAPWRARFENGELAGVLNPPEIPKISLRR